MKDEFSKAIVDKMCERGDDPVIALAFVESMQALFARQGVIETPLVLLRMDDVFASYVAVGRAEKRLEDATKRAAATADKVVALRVEENIAKARERMRKSMKEFEESCAKAGTPIDTGLADIMKPILKKAEGVLDSVLRGGTLQCREAAKDQDPTKPESGPSKSAADSEQRTVLPTQKPVLRILSLPEKVEKQTFPSG